MNSDWLELLNFVLTIAFVVEMILKLVGLGIKECDNATAQGCRRSAGPLTHAPFGFLLARQVRRRQVQRL